MSDTIAAVATGAGVSAIGIVRVSGPLSVSLMDALFRPADGKAMSQHRDRQLVYGKLLDEKGRTLDLCLCTLSRAPRSFSAMARPSCCAPRWKLSSPSARGRQRRVSSPSAPF